MEPFQLSLTTAAEQIRSRELSPVELVESVLTRIESVDDRLHAFVTVTADAARDAARRAEQEIAAGRHRGPLHGIPVGLKDLYDTAGVPTTASSRVRAEHVPARDAAVVARLAEAGAVSVGKTHTHEFAYGVLTPTTRNPWDLDRVPGGSSGGAGAAVAAGMCAVGMGSDTTGSVRIPAAVCGTVGLKPTYGRVSRRGVASLSWSLDHVGPLTRTVRDAAVVLAAVAGHDRDDPASVDVPVPDYTARLEDGVSGLTLAVPTNYFWDGIDPEVEAAVRRTVDALEAEGARLQEVTIPHAGLYHAVAFGLLLPEASAYHSRELRTKGELYGEDVRAFLEAGELVLATDYIRALQARTLLQRSFRDALDGVDALLAPTVPAPAARVGQELFTWPDGTPEPVTNAYIRTSFPASVTGVPALSVPCGATADGLPVGLQVLGRPFDEGTVLRVGRTCERASSWPGGVAPL